ERQCTGPGRSGRQWRRTSPRRRVSGPGVERGRSLAYAATGLGSMKDHRDLSALGYRRIVLALVSLVVVPTFLMLAVGVVLLFLGEAKVNLMMGILVVALSGAAATGVTLVWVFVRREANL